MARDHQMPDLQREFSTPHANHDDQGVETLDGDGMLAMMMVSEEQHLDLALLQPRGPRESRARAPSREGLSHRGLQRSQTRADVGAIQVRLHTRAMDP
jgi:hypothetical protein